MSNQGTVSGNTFQKPKIDQLLSNLNAKKSSLLEKRKKTVSINSPEVTIPQEYDLSPKILNTPTKQKTLIKYENLNNGNVMNLGQANHPAKLSCICSNLQGQGPLPQGQDKMTPERQPQQSDSYEFVCMEYCMESKDKGKSPKKDKSKMEQEETKFDFSPPSMKVANRLSDKI